MAKKKPLPSKPAAVKTVPSGPFHFKGRNFHIILALVITGFCFVIYGNSISNGFSLDDEFVIRGDTTVAKGLKGIPEVFKKRYGWDQKGSYGYRPISKVTFAIEYQFFGNSPHAGHVINILLYALFCILIFYLLRRIFYDQVGDYFLFIVMAIFIAHPLHTEVVDSLKNRDTLLSNMLGLVSMFAYIKCFSSKDIVKQVLWVLLGVISLDLGYYCKPDAFIFIALTPFVLFFCHNFKIKQAAISIPCMIIGLLLTKIFVNHMLPHSDYHRHFLFMEDPLQGTHWYQRIALGFSCIWFYVRKLIFPADLICYYGFDEIHPFPAWTDINVIMGVLLTGVFLYYVYRNKNNRGILMFSLLFFAGTLFAFCNVLKVGPGIVAERFMLLPSLGFILLVMQLLFHYFKKDIKTKLVFNNAGIVYMIVAFVIVLYSGRVIARNPDWKSHLSIYAHDVKLAPRSAKLQSLAASCYSEEIQKNKDLSAEKINEYYDIAEQAYNASVEIYPGYATSWNNLGMIQYTHHNNLDRAIPDFREAIKFDSNYTEAFFNLGMAYRNKNIYDSAEKYMLKSIKTKPDYALAYNNLTQMYMGLNLPDKALALNENAINTGHASDAVYINVGRIYMANRDTDKAIPYFEKAIAYFNKNVNLCRYLSSYFTRKGDNTKASYYQNLAEEGLKYNQEYMKRQQQER